MGRKRLSVAVAVSVLLALILASTVALLKDSLPPKDAHLRRAPLNLPDDHNAFWHFKKADDELDWPENWEKVDDVVRRSNWDSELAQELMEKNQKVIDRLAKGIACEKGVAVLGAEPPSRRLGKLLTIRCLLVLQKGRTGQAFQAAMDLIRYAHLVQGSGGSTLNYVMGSVAKRDGLKRLRNMLSKPGLSVTQLLKHAAELETYRKDKRPFFNTVRTEYEIGLQDLDSLMEKRTGLGIPAADKLPPSKFYLLPNDTKRLFIRACEAAMRRANRTGKGAGPDDESISLRKDVSEIGYLRLLITRNARGKLLHMMRFGGLHMYVRLKKRLDADLAATRLLVLLKCYEMQTGKLPDCLDALVPDYLSEIPEDPFGGSAVRYDLEKRIIYCVGEDMNDAGGYAERDIVFPIEF